MTNPARNNPSSSHPITRYAEARLLMGNLLLPNRHTPRTLQQFKEYLRLDPNGPFAAPTRELVTKIEQALGTAC